jgi:hypothetical protein
VGFECAPVFVVQGVGQGVGNLQGHIVNHMRDTSIALYLMRQYRRKLEGFELARWGVVCLPRCTEPKYITDGPMPRGWQHLLHYSTTSPPAQCAHAPQPFVH